MSEQQALWASTAGPGGIHDVLLAVAQSPMWTDWNMRHIATHRTGHPVLKAAVFTHAVTQLGAAMIRKRPDLVHLHAVDKPGSFTRSALLAWLSRIGRTPVILQMHAKSVDAFYDRSPQLIQHLIRATFNRVDAIIVMEAMSAPGLQRVAPGARIVVIPPAVAGSDVETDWRRLGTLYSEVSAAARRRCSLTHRVNQG
jgi:hypothetical protein